VALEQASAAGNHLDTFNCYAALEQSRLRPALCRPAAPNRAAPVSFNTSGQKVYPANHLEPKIWVNRIIPLRLRRETPFETDRINPSDAA